MSEDWLAELAIGPGRRDRRRSGERRSVNWRTFVQGGLTPRRRSNRRADGAAALVDWHEPHLLFLAIMILLLSIADAFLTLTLIGRGAQEANPLLAVVLDRFPRYFAAIKMVLTGAGVIVLVAASRLHVFKVVKISAIIHWCMLAYVALIAYEAWLLRQTV